MIEYLRRVYSKSQEQLFTLLYQNLTEQKKVFLVTANPEIMMNGYHNVEYDELLRDEKTLIIPDGIGVVKMAQHIGNPVPNRITGVYTVQKLLRFGDENELSAYFYGSKPEVLKKFSYILKKDYPNLKVAGMVDGYHYKDDEVMEDVLKKQPDLVFVALGVPRQELLIHRYFEQFSKGVFLGVGGSFDVLSGFKKRAPKAFIRLNCEWLYRLIKEPYRIKRFYNNNMKFIWLTKKEMKGNHSYGKNQSNDDLWNTAGSNQNGPSYKGVTKTQR